MPDLGRFGVGFIADWDMFEEKRPQSGIKYIAIIYKIGRNREF